MQATISNVQLASSLNNYILQICRSRQNFSALLAFWAGIMTEAVSGMLNKARSGIKAVQRQNEQEVILRLLPTLNEGLAMKKVPDLRIGCYMLLSVMASKGGLEDKLLTAMMEAVVLGWTTATTGPGLVCLSVLAQHRSSTALTKRVTKELLKVQELPSKLADLSKERRIDSLVNGLCLALLDRVRKRGDASSIPLIREIIENGILTDTQICAVVKALVLTAYQLEESNDTLPETRSQLASLLVALNQISGHAGLLIANALADTGADVDDIELKLQVSIRQSTIALSENMEIEEVASQESDNSTFESMLKHLPKKTVSEASFLSHEVSHVYPDLCRAFLASASNKARIEIFDQVPILRRSSAFEDSIYLTFHMKTWCGPYPVIARMSSLQMATSSISNPEVSSIDLQAMLPYALAALCDPAAKVRRAAAELLLALRKKYPYGVDFKNKSKQFRRWASADLYGPESADIVCLAPENVARFLDDMLIPAVLLR